MPFPHLVIAPMDRCPAGFAHYLLRWLLLHLLTWLLLRGRRHARSHNYSKPCQDRKPNYSDRTHVGLPGFGHPAPRAGLIGHDDVGLQPDQLLRERSYPSKDTTPQEAGR